MKDFNGLLRPALWVGLIGVLGKVMGALSGIFLAYRFGAGQATDAYLLAKTIPIAVFLILDSVIYNTFVPLLRRQGDTDALFRTLLALFFFGATLIAAGVYVGAGHLVTFLARGADAATQAEAAQLQRITAWAIIYAVPASCLKAWNACQSRYIAAALDGFVLSGVLLFALLVTPESMGIMPVAIALPAAFFILLVLQGTRAHAILQLESHVPVRELPGRYLSRLMGPLLLLNAAQQAQVLLIVVLSSFYASGAVSQVNFSYAIAQLPVGVLDLILFSTLFPFAAQLAAQRKLHELRETHENTTKALLLLAVPTALWVLLSRADLVDTLLARGLFDAEDAEATAALLFGHGLAIPAWVLEALACRVLFALGLHRRYLGVALLRLATFSAIAPLSIAFFGLSGISIAFAVSVTLSAALADWMVRRSLPLAPPGNGSRLFSRFGMTLLFVSALASAGTLGTQWIMAAFPTIYPLSVSAILVAIMVLVGTRTLLVSNSPTGTT